MCLQILYEPCFNRLRTEEQLGYSVSSGTRLTHGVLGFCISIVSGEYSAEHLDRRIEAFLTGFAERLAEMSGEEFDRHKSALTSGKMQADRNLLEEADRHWGQIWSGR